jgi:hypothetical protein
LLSDEEIAGLPDDPEEAFVELERIVRRRLDDRLAELAERGIKSESWDGELEYMNDVLAGATFFGVEALSSWRVPAPDEDVYAVYSRFTLAVANLTTQMRLAIARKRKVTAISFDPATKAKLRRLLDQMREAVDDEKRLSPRKRDALYSRIASLSKEVDSDWARSESIGNLVIELAEDTDEAVGMLDNVRRFVGDIAALLGRARRDGGGQPQLPPRREPKQIGGPPKRRPSQWDKKIDEEIPF